MINNMKKIYTTILWLLFSSLTFAQNTASQKVEMADLMRSNGKIYVVIVVMLTILAGLMIYLIRLERKIAKLEKEVSE
jgi:hypothetical protein